MTDLKSPQTESNTPGSSTPGDDPLSHLHKMSTTAGLGTTDYVAVNGMAIAALILGVASALTLFANELLVLPILAVVLAVVALIQIKDSNGTQTGRGLAALGILFALLFTGWVGGRLLVQTLGNRADEQAIDTLIGQFYQSVRDGKYDAAYGMTSAKFTSHVKPENFADTWKHIVEGTKDYPGLSGMRSNGRMEFELNQETGLKAGVGMTIMEFGPKVTPARVAMFFSKNPDGTWKISDIPDLFKPQQPPPQAPAKQR